VGLGRYGRRLYPGGDGLIARPDQRVLLRSGSRGSGSRDTWGLGRAYSRGVLDHDAVGVGAVGPAEPGRGGDEGEADEDGDAAHGVSPGGVGD